MSNVEWLQGCLNIKMPSYQYRIPLIKIRQPHNHLIFTMEIPIHIWKDGIEKRPWMSTHLKKKMKNKLKLEYWRNNVLFFNPETHHKTRPTLKRRKTLGHLRSINPNKIIHYANQSQTCQLLKILKKLFFFQRFHEKKLWIVVQSISGWTDIENPYRLSRASYTYIYWVLGINDHSHRKFTGWAIIEELSIRRRLRTFLISWGLKTRVKHCYVDLSSWYELWFAIICINMDVILGLSTAIQQF